MMDKRGSGAISYDVLRSSFGTAQSGIKSISSNKVLLLRVGNVPQDRFEFYHTALEKAGAVVDINSLTYTSPYGQDTPLRNLSRKGALRFEFQIDEANEVKTSPGWEQYHVHKRIQAVICICHCPANPDLEVPYQEYLAIKRSIPTGGPKYVKCYAFEPLDHHADVAEREDFIMFPNQDERLHMYITTWSAHHTHSHRSHAAHSQLTT